MLYRMKKNGKGLRDIGENPMINILLVCKAVNAEPIIRLYEPIAFSLNPSEECLEALPQTLKRNIRDLQINAGRLFRSLTGIRPYEHDAGFDDEAKLAHEYDAYM